jgi:ABC-type Fe3+-hydroxamate transport system substrate-binding protein
MERIYTDQMNRTIRLGGIPCRIVSLVPSQTELLYDLGLIDEVVGITKFCIYPESWFTTKTRVGGTKQVNIEKVRELKPDLIIGNKEENTKEDIEALMEIAPVWMSDIYSIDDALEMINAVGEMTDKAAAAKSMVAEIEKAFQMLKNPLEGKSVLYFIWKDPYYAVGPETFIHSMITTLGWRNVVQQDRYPEWDENAKEQPDYVFLSSEPYPFKEEHVAEVQRKFPRSTVILVDGEMFSWYGSRMRLAPAYFMELFDHLIQ